MTTCTRKLAHPVCLWNDPPLLPQHNRYTTAPSRSCHPQGGPAEGEALDGTVRRGTTRRRRGREAEPRRDRPEGAATKET